MILLAKKRIIKTMNNIQKFDSFLNENNSLQLPDDLTIEYLFTDVNYSDDDMDILSTFFKTNKEFIEPSNPQYCVYSVQDFKTDISKNNRTKYDVLLLADFQIEKIKDNLVKKILSELISQIPVDVSYMGILVKPHTVLDKEKINNAIKNIYTEDKMNKLITHITGFRYIDKVDQYFIWKKQY